MDSCVPWQIQDEEGCEHVDTDDEWFGPGHVYSSLGEIVDMDSTEIKSCNDADNASTCSTMDASSGPTTETASNPEDLNGPTTICVRNIPSNYNTNQVLEWVTYLLTGVVGCSFSLPGCDFFYYPIDYLTDKGKGYLFLNFVSHAIAEKCRLAFTGFEFAKWHGKGKKVSDVCWAKDQGLVSNISKQLKVICDESLPESWKPIVFFDGIPMTYKAAQCPPENYTKLRNRRNKIEVFLDLPPVHEPEDSQKQN